MIGFIPTVEAYSTDTWIPVTIAAEMAGVSVAAIHTQIDQGLVSWRIQGVTTLVDREDIELRMTNGAVRDYHAPEMYALV
ncbi:hypothetical protein [Corynebacterium variabile]|uniref:hypothetical protein n=1 Tax=Corynebacterium variabile TaxID=1727 RepID=UPI00289C2FF1|nr:hypothetical protein [Corynebacterium variabile]